RRSVQGTREYTGSNEGRRGKDCRKIRGFEDREKDIKNAREERAADDSGMLSVKPFRLAMRCWCPRPTILATLHRVHYLSGPGSQLANQLVYRAFQAAPMTVTLRYPAAGRHLRRARAVFSTFRSCLRAEEMLPTGRAEVADVSALGPARLRRAEVSRAK